MAARILLLEDNAQVRHSLGIALGECGFEVVLAATVTEALSRISSESYDVLLSDLPTPHPADGMAVVAAMRRAHPKAVSLLLSGYPEIQAASREILLQVDEVMTKPVDVPSLVETIKQRLGTEETPRVQPLESVAAILNRSSPVTIQRWLEFVHADDGLMNVALKDRDRMGHLPQMFLDLVIRLRLREPLGTRALRSLASAEHGMLRRQQGYSASMVVEESRILQVCIFETLQNNMGTVDFSVVLLDVMTIADEVDSQLAQAMEAFMAESVMDGLSDEC